MRTRNNQASTRRMSQLRTKGGKRDPIKNWALREEVCLHLGAPKGARRNLHKFMNKPQPDTVPLD